jgi:hypothetical protein
MGRVGDASASPRTGGQWRCRLPRRSLPYRWMPAAPSQPRVPLPRLRSLDSGT